MYTIPRIVFAGPVGVGKTTSIATVSDIPLVTTEAKASDDTAKLKEKTTVAMDYGVMNLEGGKKAHLYGTPGSGRFDFMWEIIAQGSTGLVLLLDNSREDPLADMEFYLNAFKDLVSEQKVVVGITRMEDNPHLGIHKHRAKLKELGQKNTLVLEVDGRSRSDMKILLMTLIDTEPNDFEQNDFELSDINNTKLAANYA